MLSFERSTRLRDHVGSQNGTVSDPAEGTRYHTGKEGAPCRRHQKEVWQTRRLVRSLKACTAAPAASVTPLLSTPAATPPPASYLMPLPPPKLSHQSCTIRVALRLHANLRVVARSQTVGMTKSKLNCPLVPRSQAPLGIFGAAGKVRWPFPLALRVRAGGVQPLRHPLHQAVQAVPGH